MAEFVEVLKQRKRMCETLKCDSCWLSYANNNCDKGCSTFIIDYYEQAEEIIMNWAKEHPIQTNGDKFKEVFGIENVKRCVIKDTEECEKYIYCTDCKYNDFWQQEYVEPKGESNDRTKE